MTKLMQVPGPGGWTFALVPDRHAPPVTHGWGRTPVLARVDGEEWETSVWRDKAHGTLLPVPKPIRGPKGDGDVVEVELRPRASGRKDAGAKASASRATARQASGGVALVGLAAPRKRRAARKSP